MTIFPFFSVPMFGGQSDACFKHSWGMLTRELAAMRMPYAFNDTVFDPDIHRGRARLAHEALKVGATHLFQIDADIGFTPETVFRLLRSGHDVCGVPYRRKGKDPGGYNVLYLPEHREANSVPVDEETGFGEVRALGGGFQCITTDALLKLCYAHPELLCVSDSAASRGECYFQLFQGFVTPKPERRYMSEDYAICERWRMLGGGVMMYPWAELIHAGRGTWRGALADNPIVKEDAA